MRNPYAENGPTEKSFATLFASLPALNIKSDKDKRQELIEYFSRKIGKPEGYVRFKLKGMMDLSTLYFIKSDCDQANNRGIPWGAAFYTSIKSK